MPQNTVDLHKNPQSDYKNIKITSSSNQYVNNIRAAAAKHVLIKIYILSDNANNHL